MSGPHRQTIFHDDPGGRPGNCMQAAVASLGGWELGEVPHFMRGDPVDQPSDGLWWYAYVGFLAALEPAHRLCSVEVDPRHPGELPDHPCLVVGKSPRGDFAHVVVYWGAPGDWWDPHPSGAGLDTVTRLEWWEPWDQEPTR